MLRHRVFVLAAATSLSLVACGDDGGAAESQAVAVPTAQDFATAATCDEVADLLSTAAQVVLDSIGSAGVDEPPQPVSPEAAAEEVDVFALGAAAFQRTDLCGTEEALERLLCQRNAGLRSHGPAGDEFKTFWYAPSHCEDMDGGSGPVATTSGSLDDG